MTVYFIAFGHPFETGQSWKSRKLDTKHPNQNEAPHTWTHNGRYSFCKKYLLPESADVEFRDRVFLYCITL